MICWSSRGSERGPSAGSRESRKSLRGVFEAGRRSSVGSNSWSGRISLDGVAGEWSVRMELMPKPSLKVKSVSKSSSKEEAEKSSMSTSSGSGTVSTKGRVVPGGAAEDGASLVEVDVWCAVPRSCGLIWLGDGLEDEHSSLGPGENPEERLQVGEKETCGLVEGVLLQ
jgi:hypothetical protein